MASLHISVFLAALPHRDITTFLFFAALPHGGITTSDSLPCSSTPWWHHYISSLLLHIFLITTSLPLLCSSTPWRHHYISSLQLYPMVALLHLSLFLAALSHVGIATSLRLPCRSTPWRHHYISSLQFYPMVALLHLSLFLAALSHGGIATSLRLRTDHPTEPWLLLAVSRTARKGTWHNCKLNQLIPISSLLTLTAGHIYCCLG